MVTGDSSTVTLTLKSGNFAGGGNAATVQAVNGVATFSGLVLDAARTYTLIASDGALTRPHPQLSPSTLPSRASSSSSHSHPSRSRPVRSSARR